jgi:hypothetical protein
MNRPFIRLLLAMSFCTLFQGCQEFARVIYGKKTTQSEILKSWRASLPVSFTTLQPAKSFDSMEPEAAFDNNGNAIIVWEQYNDQGYNIHKSEYRGGSWTHPTSLNDHINPIGPGDAYGPQVAMDASGNAIITWLQDDQSSIRQIYKSEYRGSVWTHPTSLSDNISPDGTAVTWPSLAMNNTGSAIITWTQPEAAVYQVFKSEYRGGAWTHPSGISDNISPAAQNAQNPIVSIDDAGNSLIVWNQSDGLNMQVFKSEYRLGVWVHPTNLSNYISVPGRSANGAQVAMDNNGNAVIVWRQYNGANNQIFKSEYRLGAWIHPVDQNDNISPDGYNADRSQVAMDDSGNAIIVWYQYVASIPQIYKSEYRLSAWTHPADINDKISVTGTGALYPQVAMANGNAIIVWEQDDASARPQVFKAEYRSNTWSYPSGLADFISPVSGRGNAPQVAMDNAGNALIVWRQRTSYDYGIFIAEYRSSAWSIPVDSEDHISPKAQIVLDPQVAINDRGEAIIVWTQVNGSINQIFKSEYRSNTWIHPLDLSEGISPAGSSPAYPRVGIDNNGNALISWMQRNGAAHFQIYKSEFRNNSWTHPADINDHISLAGQDVGMPQTALSMDKNGNALIVWQQFNGANAHIYKSEYRNNTWSHPASWADKMSPDGQHAYDPQIAMDNNNQSIVVWKQYDGSANHIYKAEFRNNAWVIPLDLTDKISPTGSYAHDPQIAMDNNNNALIVWRQHDGSFNQVFKSEYRGATWTHPTGLTDNIAPDGKAVGYYPQVAMNNNDQAVIAWLQEDGTTTQVFKSEYRENQWFHPASSSDNISTDGVDYDLPQVALTSEGNAIITMESYLGIEALRYKNGTLMDRVEISNSKGADLHANAHGEAILTYVSIPRSSEINTGIFFKQFK